MNQFRGNIEGIEVSGSLSLVRVRVAEFLLSAIIIDTPDTLHYLEPGREVSVVFKETEVVLGTSSNLTVSLQNRIPGTVAAIEHGQLLSRVTLDTNLGPLVSVITSKAVTQLGFAEGSAAVALIKTNEMMLSA